MVNLSCLEMIVKKIIDVWDALRRNIDCRVGLCTQRLFNEQEA